MQFLKSAVTALAILGGAAGGVAAQQGDPDGMDDLFTALRDAGPDAADEIAQKIWEQWSRSGSPAMDLLLERGREAMEQGDPVTAIGHFTALIDHAPEFAEGYNARATAYFQNGQYGPALDDIRTTLSLNPRHFGALAGLGTIMEELGHDDLALRAWKEVEELNPSQENLTATIERLERRVGGTTL